MTEQKTTSPEMALRLRKRVKKKKPNFVRHESWRYTRLKENWRKPRGLDNKMRRKIKGWPPTVSIGYRGPKVARGLHPSGYREVLVCNPTDLKKVDPKTQAIRISHTVGKRKRTRIITEARKKKIIILNLKEAKEAVEKEKLAEEKKEVAEEEKEETVEEEEAKEEKKKKEKPKRKQKKARRSKEKAKEQ
jgi:large subunit ribosomal protein L32e